MEADPSIPKGECVRSTQRFLHDVVGQQLCAIGMKLDLLAWDYAADPAVAPRVAEMQGLVETLIGQIRDFGAQINRAAPAIGEQSR